MCSFFLSISPSLSLLCSLLEIKHSDPRRTPSWPSLFEILYLLCANVRDGLANEGWSGHPIMVVKAIIATLLVREEQSDPRRARLYWLSL